MSNRERWVVYPLLFLALSASLRDKITGHSQSLQYITGQGMKIDLQHGLLHGKSIEGAQLVAGNELRGQKIRGNEIHAQLLVVDEIHCRGLAVLDRKGNPVVIASNGEKDGNLTAGGSLRLYNHSGKSNCSLDADKAGGLLTLEDSAGTLSLVLGHLHEADTSGLMAIGIDGKSAALAPLIKRAPAKPASEAADRTGRPPEPPASADDSPADNPPEKKVPARNSPSQGKGQSPPGPAT